MKGLASIFLLVAVLITVGTLNQNNTLAVDVPNLEPKYTVESVSSLDLSRGRPQDRVYQGVKFNAGELESCPCTMDTEAHYFDLVDLNGQVLNRQTGCGEVFNPREELGVASWFYPCGTILRITNLDNGKSVIGVVKDRGPNTAVYPETKIDLYRKTFEDLGRAIYVRVEVIFGCNCR